MLKDIHCLSFARTSGVLIADGVVGLPGVVTQEALAMLITRPTSLLGAGVEAMVLLLSSKPSSVGSLCCSAMGGGIVREKMGGGFEDRGTDGRNRFRRTWYRRTESISKIVVQTDGIDFGLYSQRHFKWHSYQSWKLVGNEENNIPPPLH